MGIIFKRGSLSSSSDSLIKKILVVNFHVIKLDAWHKSEIFLNPVLNGSK